MGFISEISAKKEYSRTVPSHIRGDHFDLTDKQQLFTPDSVSKWFKIVALYRVHCKNHT